MSPETGRPSTQVRAPGLTDHDAMLSDRANVRRLEPLGAARHVELHLLPLGEGAEPLRLDGGVVAEHVVAAAVLRDEAEALRIVEPLHSTSSHLLFDSFFSTVGRSCR